MPTHLWVWRVVLHQKLLDLHPLLGVCAAQRGIDLVQVLQRQVWVQVMHLLELLQRIEHLGANRVPF
jgi:hypothetical protein